jgi:hypothetical protein
MHKVLAASHSGNMAVADEPPLLFPVSQNRWPEGHIALTNCVRPSPSNFILHLVESSGPQANGLTWELAPRVLLQASFSGRSIRPVGG